MTLIRKILREKLDYSVIWNLYVQIRSWSDQILETGSGSDHIMKTGSGTDLILKTGSGPDQQPYQLESKLQLPVPNSYIGKLQQLQKEIDSRLDDNTPAGF